MPIILGEPAGGLAATQPPQVIGPMIAYGNLSANSAFALRVPLVNTAYYIPSWWALTYGTLRLRGFSGYINANGVAAASNVVINAAASASGNGGQDVAASLAAAQLTLAGGFTGPFSLKLATPLGLPASTASGGGTVLGMFVTATAAGSIDMAGYLHLES